MVTDPEIVEDIYVKYNKYFDKSGRSKNTLYDLFGEGLVLIESNETWRQKRKHMSVAFYKDKMISLLDIVADLTFERITQWKRDYAGKPDKEFLIIR